VLSVRSLAGACGKQKTWGLKKLTLSGLHNFNESLEKKGVKKFGKPEKLSTFAPAMKAMFLFIYRERG
jgi:hypothetical protein